MISIRKTRFFDNLIKEFNYDFGDIFLFEGYIVSEIKEGKTITWEDHTSVMTRDICDLIGSNGEDHIYISHRINSYSVMPSDWLKFFKHSYSLKGYGVVGYTQNSNLNTVIENLFFKRKIKRFNNLETAIQWATNEVLSIIED